MKRSELKDKLDDLFIFLRQPSGRGRGPRTIEFGEVDELIEMAWEIAGEEIEDDEETSDQ